MAYSSLLVKTPSAAKVSEELTPVQQRTELCERRMKHPLVCLLQIDEKIRVVYRNLKLPLPTNIFYDKVYTLIILAITKEIDHKRMRYPG